MPLTSRSQTYSKTHLAFIPFQIMDPASTPTAINASPNDEPEHGDDYTATLFTALEKLLEVPRDIIHTRQLRRFLSGTPSSRLHQLLDSLKQLSRCCEDMCSNTAEPNPTTTTPPYEQDDNSNDSDESPSPEEIQGHDHLPGVQDNTTCDQPGGQYGYDNDDVSLHSDDADAQTCMETAYGKLRHINMNEQDCIDPSKLQLPSPRCDPEDVVVETPEDSYRVTSSRGSSPGEVTEKPSGSKPQSPKLVRTPLKTIVSRQSPVYLKETTEDASSDDRATLIVTQSITAFVDSSLEEIDPFRFPADMDETFQSLFTCLHKAHQSPTQYSSGSKWMSLVGSNDAKRQKGSIYYALTSIGFYAWHSEQVSLICPQSSEKGRKQVSQRIIGPLPTDAEEKKQT
ncbi:hypothetical protein F5B22DRAFT_263725 [Xylaria bambusicola]|uniref:uncharacterized protein n=1 Tax=Xylaria bambusicola TaxID=326684 RepID=UPI002008D8F8|nr:uncharacterized protein F5B22DRAFT_263725 [Xylaria bambusicola]KAI0525994.1 hypothetical protein F5B22DRAFT_263725 [Xylaria bambusicola]